MAKGTSPTQRSLKHLRELGYQVGVTEKWNPFARIRQDLFGFFDMVCVHPERKILGVQTTTRPNMAARLEKAKGNAALVAWILAGGCIQVHGWIKRKGHWVVDIRDLSISDLAVQTNVDFSTNP